MSRSCRGLRLLVLAALLGESTVAQLAAEHPPARAQRVASRRLGVVGLPNFAEVTPELYRGGQPTPEGFRKLATMGIHIVVDVRLSGRAREKQEVSQLGMEFVALPWHCLVPKDEVFAKFLALLRANRNQKVFVHCRFGDDRTGMMVAAYRMAIEGWTAEQAKKEMNEFGFHHLICHSLVEYERQFPEHLKRGSAFRSAQTATPPRS